MSLIEMYFEAHVLTDEQKADLSRKVTDLIASETGKPYTQVVIYEIPPENWMIDRKTLKEL